MPAATREAILRLSWGENYQGPKFIERYSDGSITLSAGTDFFRDSFVVLKEEIPGLVQALREWGMI